VDLVAVRQLTRAGAKAESDPCAAAVSGFAPRQAGPGTGAATADAAGYNGSRATPRVEGSS
jgi:hypothetical protein